MTRRRLLHVAAAMATIALGLALRANRDALPPAFVDMAGDALWAAMMFWWIGALAPRASIGARALWALGVAYVVEVAQLWRAPWLVALRGTRLGHLVLGTDFDARDLLAYAAGVACAAALAVTLAATLVATLAARKQR
ncbi:MAG: ribosomal maturation YjgA family protein [Gemmatirosa sp.]